MAYKPEMTRIASISSMPSTHMLVQKHIFRGQGSRTHRLAGYQKPRRNFAACQLGSSGQESGPGSRAPVDCQHVSQKHIRQDAAPIAVPGDRELAQAACRQHYMLVLGSSTLLWASTAAAHASSPEAMYLQQAAIQEAEQPSQALFLADFSLLPSINGAPWQFLGFLLHHPFVTLALALGLNYLVPRAFRAAVRFLVFPLVLGSAIWVALQNPSAAWGLLRGAFDFAIHHTIETSAVILIGLGFVLSPYLLLGAAVFLLLFGVPNIPAFMRPMVPAPLLEVQRRADEVQKGLQQPLKALGDGIEHTTEGIMRTFGTKTLP